MEITEKYLIQQKQVLSQEAANTMQKLHRLQGAIGLCEALIVELEEEIPTMEEAISELMPGTEILDIVETMEDEDEAEV